MFGIFAPWRKEPLKKRASPLCFSAAQWIYSGEGNITYFQWSEIMYLQEQMRFAPHSIRAVPF